MSTAVSSHSGAGPLSLMSCVRESSPPQDAASDFEPEKNVSTKKKFWNPRKWFKRKSNKVVEEAPSSNANSNQPEGNNQQALRSRSTSELSVAEEQTRRRSGTPMHPGLSVSHDSVFHSPHSGSELDLDAAQSSSSLSISHQPTQPDIRLQTELLERLKQRRGDTSEDDEGLPHSPCNSPTTTEGHLDKSHHKDHPTKSHSTCSDGSLLSMGSSEMDEDFDPQPKITSKLSLPDKNKDVTDADITEWGPIHSSIPLNHSAAHHKVSIRPKRTHGAPRRKRTPNVVLPTTPEVNEDSSYRSMTPEVNTKETLTELYTSMSYHHTNSQKDYHRDYKMKCSSLPPGLAGPGSLDDGKLTRSRSNAGTHGQDSFAEEDEDCHKSKDTSFFGRIFPRRSGKKKKCKQEEKEFVKEASTLITSSYTKISESTNVNYDPFDRNMIAVDSNLAIRPNALRSGPASRQRVQPIDITQSPEASFHINSSPMHDELDEWFQRQPSITTECLSMNTSVTDISPPNSPLIARSPPKSPWSDKPPLINNKFMEHTTTSSSVMESKSIVRIAGLSPFQQSVISWNDDIDTGFKSLTNFPSDYEKDKPAKPVAKSHSFKTTKTNLNHQVTTHKSMEEKSMFKSISLDSVKNADHVENRDVPNNDDDKIEQQRDAITITGPSHKAIVNVTSFSEKLQETFEIIERTSKMEKTELSKISVTKVQLNSDTITTAGNAENRQLVKSSSMTDPTICKLNSDMNFSKSLESPISTPVRKFSNDNIEVIKKEDIALLTSDDSKMSPVVTVTSMTNASHYRKHVDNKRDFKPVIRTKSNSFDSVESKSSTPKSSQSSLDKLETKSQENIKTCNESVVRRKSLGKQRQDEEPELMKVFARRSLKLRDNDIDVVLQQVAKPLDKENIDKEKQDSNKSRDSDKENLSDSSPIEDRKKPQIAPKTTALLGKVKIDGTDVLLRKPVANKWIEYSPRPLTTTTIAKSDDKVLKPNVVLPTRAKTEGKFPSTEQKNKDLHHVEIINTKNMNTVENINNISEKSDIIQDEGNIEVQNVRRRKAEWEKRAQESIRKS